MGRHKVSSQPINLDEVAVPVVVAGDESLPSVDESSFSVDDDDDEVVAEVFMGSAAGWSSPTPSPS